LQTIGNRDWPAAPFSVIELLNRGKEGIHVHQRNDAGP
jgi:hypothetical protein